MKNSIIGATLLTISGVAFAHSNRYGSCQEFNIPIKASAENSHFNLTQIDDNITARSWALTEDYRSTLPAPFRITENITVSGVYNIHGKFCCPKTHHGNRSATIQIATHGAHYDSRYWDPEFDPIHHSWVEATLKEGYSILTYDRLGAGKSDHPDAYEVVQAGLELDILRQLTIKTRDGFGSFLTSAFISTYPELSDAAIITGYVFNKYLGSVGYTTWSVQNARTADIPFDRPSGYVVCQTAGIQNIFFGGNPHTAFTKEALAYADATKQPVPVGELASALKLVGLPGLNFTGPVQIVLAEHDYFVCKGDCNGVTDLSTLKQIYPKSSAIGLEVQPNTGHALPLHSNATSGFDLTFNFLQKNGF